MTLSIWQLAHIVEDMDVHCRHDGTRLTAQHVGYYKHDGGVLITETEPKKAWVYFTCPKCGYSWALWKLLQQAKFLEQGDAAPWRE